MANNNFIDIAGLKFGKLTAIKRVTKEGRAGVKFLCTCECGNETIVYSCHLKSGHTKSCGCFVKYVTGKMFTTHGKRNTSTYRCWMGMMRRCTNKNSSNYKWYGGRNISVCHEWKRFEVFLEDMGERPVGMELDRINNDAGYCKENCRWITHKENCQNRRKKVITN